MEVRLRPFDFTQAATKAGMPQVAERVRASAANAGLSGTNGADSVQGAGFQSVLSQALRSVSETQNTARTLQREVSLDNPTVSIEETMVAMQKSQIGFQATLAVRNKLVQAYTDIMGMQI